MNLEITEHPARRTCILTGEKKALFDGKDGRPRELAVRLNGSVIAHFQPAEGSPINFTVNRLQLPMAERNEVIGWVKEQMPKLSKSPVSQPPIPVAQDDDYEDEE